MDDIGVIDRFLNTFNRYIDSGFGLLGGEISFLTATLIAIDITLAGLTWAMSSSGAEDVIARLIKKTIYIGAFAFILGNFSALSSIVFRSMAGLGLVAGGSGLTEADLLRPGRLAGVGVDAGRPIMDEVGDLAGFPEVFMNIDEITVLLLAWLIVIVSFFILAVQMFVCLIEFKLTTLAGFVLVPFALWGKSAFLAERVLGSVISAGIKVLVLAVIVGIGTGIFGEFTAPIGDITMDHALAVMLASLALLGLGLFGPGIATGLVSGAPQLGGGAAAGTMMAVGGLGVAAGGAVAGTARLAGALGGGAFKAGSAGVQAYRAGAEAAGSTGAASVGAGVANVARTAGSAIASGAKRVVGAGTSPNNPEDPGERGSSGKEPGWAKRMRHRQNITQGVSAAVHVLRSTDHAGSGANPSLKESSS